MDVCNAVVIFAFSQFTWTYSDVLNVSVFRGGKKIMYPFHNLHERSRYKFICL